MRTDIALVMAIVSWGRLLLRDGKDDGGLDRELEVEGSGDVEVFECKLDMIQPRPQGPPWYDARFARTTTRAPSPAATLDEAEAALRAPLAGLAELGARADLGHWTKVFANALAAIDEQTLGEWSPISPQAPIRVRALAHASMLASVFGGMGSWTDFHPLADSRLEHERHTLGEALFKASFVVPRAAVNAL